MKYKELGKTNTNIPSISGHLSKDSHQDGNQLKTLRLGFELGMTFIDTAEAYGNGHSEVLIGKAIKGIRNKVFIASKVSPEHLYCESEGMTTIAYSPIKQGQIAGDSKKTKALEMLTNIYNRTMVQMSSNW